MGAAEINEFLLYLAVELNVSSSTQNQALCALLFLYRDVLEEQVPWLSNLVRAKKPRRIPVVLTRREVRRLLEEMEGTPRLIAELLYGSGMRLLECLRLRVKDVELARREIVIRDGKGRKDRVSVLPARSLAALREHLRRVAELHRGDLEKGYGVVYMPCTGLGAASCCIASALLFRVRLQAGELGSVRPTSSS